MFSLFFWVLLATPLASPVAAWWLSGQSPRVQRRILKLLACMLAIVAGALATGLSTASAGINAVLWLLAWFAFAVLGMSAFRLRPKVVAYALGLLAALPGIAGLLFATAGVTGLMGAVAGLAPQHAEQLAPRLRCHVHLVEDRDTSQEAYEVTLRRQSPILPWFEYAARMVLLDDIDIAPAAACRRAFPLEAGAARASTIQSAGKIP